MISDYFLDAPHKSKEDIYKALNSDELDVIKNVVESQFEATVDVLCRKIKFLTRYIKENNRRLIEKEELKDEIDKIESSLFEEMLSYASVAKDIAKSHQNNDIYELWLNVRARADKEYDCLSDELEYLMYYKEIEYCLNNDKIYYHESFVPEIYTYKNELLTGVNIPNDLLSYHAVALICYYNKTEVNKQNRQKVAERYKRDSGEVLMRYCKIMTSQHERHNSNFKEEYEQIQPFLTENGREEAINDYQLFLNPIA